MRVEDKFLDKLTFYRIQKAVFSSDTFWRCVKNISGSTSDQEKDVYFVHMIYDYGDTGSRLGWIADILKEAIGADKLMRVKANLYPRTDTLVHHTPHIDYEFEHKGALLSLNTCNGHTKVGNEIFSSVKNRMLFFDPRVLHNSTNCTNAQFRCNININYDPVISGHQNRL
tara:strand:- start:188 stop:697 length:510 start_codon:yes stop_codon:yes gene_type:complete